MGVAAKMPRGQRVNRARARETLKRATAEDYYRGRKIQPKLDAPGLEILFDFRALLGVLSDAAPVNAERIANAILGKSCEGLALRAGIEGGQFTLSAFFDIRPGAGGPPELAESPVFLLDSVS